MTTIDDVARIAGVSTATVSRSLRGLPGMSEDTRNTVLSVAEKLGYVTSGSASDLASGRTLSIGVVVPSVSRWFFTTVLEGIDAELRKANYDMVLFNLGSRGGERERVFHRSILRRKTDALIALCLDFTDDERRQLASTEQPTIIIGGPVRGHGLRHIGIDGRKAAEEAMQHLLNLGHRKIAHIGGPDSEGLDPRVPLARRTGYIEALEAANIPVRTDWILDGGFGTAQSREAMGALLAQHETPPTAVFAASDEMAIGAILAIQDRGLSVPGDISVIGIDNHELAESFKLTTIAQDPFEQGARGARIVLAELAGQAVRAGSIKAPTHLIERSSTAPPPANKPE